MCNEPMKLIVRGKNADACDGKDDRNGVGDTWCEFWFVSCDMARVLCLIPK
jgi:hypothetical protein